jgi:shikimate dehydrogenase
MAEQRVKKAFICGHPIGHSRSPMIHGYWLRQFGIDGSYEPVDVAPADIADFFAGLKQRGFVGGNVTIPHKEEAFAAVARRDAAAEAIGAVNTLWFEDGELVGGNTDAIGFASNLDELAPGWAKAGPAVVLGAGGAARAVIQALKERGFADIRITNRTLERARDLADRFGDGVSAHPAAATQELLSDCGLLINTTALGMAGKHGSDALPANPEALPRHAIVTDIVYVPLETPLLGAARRCGLKTVDGLGMLLHQAVPGFERWFGRRPDVTQELRAMIIADMAAQMPSGTDKAQKS